MDPTLMVSTLGGSEYIRPTAMASFEYVHCLRYLEWFVRCRFPIRRTLGSEVMTTRSPKTPRSLAMTTPLISHSKQEMMFHCDRADSTL